MRPKSAKQFQNRRSEPKNRRGAECPPRIAKITQSHPTRAISGLIWPTLSNQGTDSSREAYRVVEFQRWSDQCRPDNPMHEASILRRWIMLIFACWLTPVIFRSRSCLCLVSGIIPCGRPHNPVEDSPHRAPHIGLSTRHGPGSGQPGTSTCRAIDHTKPVSSRATATQILLCTTCRALSAR